MISDTLYAQYLKERQGAQIIEDEFGFIVFKKSKTECFVMELFVRKEYRRTGKGSKLFDRLFEECSECDVVTANIWLWDPNANSTLAAALAFGFKLAMTGEGFIRVHFDLSKKGGI